MRRHSYSTAEIIRSGAFAAYMTPLAYSAQASHCGRRSENQDSVLQVSTLDGALVCLLADGLGSYGRQASHYVVQTVAMLYGMHPYRDPRQMLSWAVEQTHQRMVGWRRGLPRAASSACTLEAAVILPQRVLLAHSGDSRSYLLRGQRLYLLTRDHTLPGMLLSEGRISAEQAALSPYRNQLLRFIGVESGPATDYTELATLPGDCLLLCSDGLWGSLIEADLISWLYNRAPARAVIELLRLALERGSSDNVSLIIVQVH